MKRIISILSIIIILTLTVLPLCLGVSAAPNYLSGSSVYVIPNNENIGSEQYKQYVVPYVLDGEQSFEFPTNSVGIFELFLGSSNDFDAMIQIQGYATIYLFNGTYLTVTYYPQDGYCNLSYYYNILGVTKSTIFYTGQYNHSSSASYADFHFYVDENGRLMLYQEGGFGSPQLVPNDLYGCVFSLNQSPESIYNQGFLDGENNVSDRYQEGYDDGYDIGLEEGYTNGYQVGYHNGIIEAGNENTENAYGEGFAAGRDQGFIEGQQVENITFNAILGFFQGLTNFFEPFFRVGIGSITVSSLLGITLVVSIGAIIIKILRG